MRKQKKMNKVFRVNRYAIEEFTVEEETEKNYKCRLQDGQLRYLNKTRESKHLQIYPTLPLARRGLSRKIQEAIARITHTEVIVREKLDEDTSDIGDVVYRVRYTDSEEFTVERFPVINKTVNGWECDTKYSKYDDKGRLKRGQFFYPSTRSSSADSLVIYGKWIFDNNQKAEMKTRIFSFSKLRLNHLNRLLELSLEQTVPVNLM